MRTNFKLIVSTGSSAVPEPRTEHRESRTESSEPRIRIGTQTLGLAGTQLHGPRPRCPKNARPLHATWLGWDGMVWDTMGWDRDRDHGQGYGYME